MDEKERDKRRSEIILKDSDFLCERRLKALSPELHKRYRSSVFAMDMLLANYKALFPFYTNHTFGHSAQVINYCNILIGPENIERLNADELYILLMGACLHDIGMGISASDYDEMRNHTRGVSAYLTAHPGADQKEVTREFHQEFSAEFISKYRDLFEIPSDAHLDCICRIARGHRNYDLLDETEFPPQYRLPDGSVVHLPYLAALTKLADEMDVTADRNLLFDYSNLGIYGTPLQIMCYKCHKALTHLAVEGDALILWYRTDEQEVCDEIMRMDAKAQRVFREFADVVRERTDFTLVQTSLHYQKEKEKQAPAAAQI